MKVTGKATVSDNKAIVLQFLDSWNRRDFDSMKQRWAPDLVHHARSGTYGPERVSYLMESFMKAFPDLKFTVENIIADGDFVATRMTARATHQQKFMDLPATGKPITCSVMGLVRLANGLIAEHWNTMDELNLLQQLGLVPSNYLEAMASPAMQPSLHTAEIGDLSTM